MRLFVYSLEKTLYEGEADSVTMPAKDGEITVLNHHIPLVTALRAGQITLKTSNNKFQLEVGGGIAQVDKDRVVVLAD